MSNIDFIPAGAKQSIAAPSVPTRSVSVKESELGDLPAVSCFPPPPPPYMPPTPPTTASTSSQKTAPFFGTTPLPPPLPREILEQGAKSKFVFPPPARSDGTRPDAGKRTISLISPMDYVVRPIEWLWKGYLAKGVLTNLSSPGGSGKSTIASSFAATITIGGTWPDGTHCQQPGNVVFWGSEEGLGDTVIARMTVNKADAHRYRILAGSKDEFGNPLSFDPAHDMKLLHEALAQMGGISLFVIDPLIAVMKNGDSNKQEDVRKSLQPLVDFAAEFNCAVMGVTHTGKSRDKTKPADGQLGSVAFRDVPRMVLAAEKEDNSPDGSFTRSKSNIATTGDGYRYKLLPTSFVNQRGQLIETTTIEWGEALEGSARSILSDIEESYEQDGSALGKAKELLRTQLANGPVYATVVESAAKELGVSPATLRRAREAMKIRNKKDMDNGGKSRWSLPEMGFDMTALDQMPMGRVSAQVSKLPWAQTTDEQL